MCIYIHRYVYTYTCGCVSSRRHLYILNTTFLHLTLTCLHQQFVDVFSNAYLWTVSQKHQTCDVDTMLQKHCERKENPVHIDHFRNLISYFLYI